MQRGIPFQRDSSLKAEFSVISVCLMSGEGRVKSQINVETRRVLLCLAILP